MFSFSPLLILIPFGLIAAIIGFFSLINISHLVRTGNTTLVSLFFTLVFLGYSLGVIFLTYNTVVGYDWQTPLTIDLSSLSAQGGGY